MAGSRRLGYQPGAPMFWKVMVPPCEGGFEIALAELRGAEAGADAVIAIVAVVIGTTR